MTPNLTNPAPLALHTSDSTPHREDQLRTVSEKLEAQFLAEMLKLSGFGKTPKAFGGGNGEDQFTSFLVEAQAQKIVEAGGVGLAEQIFNSLKEQSNGTL